MSSIITTTAASSLPLDRTPRHRSGAAARLAGMPVNTLRIWERRYGVVRPPKSPSGQRLYSNFDVQRLACLRALVERGHAIGTIASLDWDALQQLLHARRGLAARLQPPELAPEANTLRLALVGGVLRQRWLDASEAGHFHLVASHESLAAALAANGLRPVDALCVQVGALDHDNAQAILQLAERCAARDLAVVYAFGTATAAESLRLAGARVCREPLGDPEFRQLLDDLAGARSAGESESASHWVRTPPRYTDEHLGFMARLSTTVACECPRHMATLIMQLSAFEAYSDNCASRTPADAALHHHLGDVASRARALFESALDRLALEEGWDIPRSATSLDHS